MSNTIQLSALIAICLLLPACDYKEEKTFWCREADYLAAKISQCSQSTGCVYGPEDLARQDWAVSECARYSRMEEQ